VAVRPEKKKIDEISDEPDEAEDNTDKVGERHPAEDNDRFIKEFRSDEHTDDR
jgi:hypothetical protein